jgi:hypothetical protein
MPTVQKSVERYQVWCESCGSVYTPPIHSATWWKAKQRADEGFLDALCVSGTECGCVEKRPVISEENFGIIGYTMDCFDFTIKCKTFVDLCKAARQMKNGDTFWIIGPVSQAVKDRLTGW